ncbi:MAG TPA: efflux RND transporter permease subunit, partial [Kofleriaceae bacterium]|nr:efflux RND transporter permease subunit [Kofleriaceae bacterium]
AFERMIVKTGADGTLVQIHDVGRVELGGEDYGVVLRFNGKDAIGLGIFQLPTANALDVEQGVREQLETLAKTFPPGLHYDVGFDPTTAVRESIHDVLQTLAEAILIVIAVIFVFLQGWRTTIIPAVTIPVSLVGTFIFVKAFGFSINTLTLFGLTLATGLVVDDAIVVIENIERHLHDEEHTPAEAAAIAMREVAGAVIATSLVLVAVFVPVSFFPGATGRIYQQFSLTIAFSIALSAFNALTLSPALAAKLLRRRTKPKWRVFRAIDRALDWTHDRYGGLVRRSLRRRWIVIIAFVLGLVATAWIYRRTPSGFVPDEDQGYLIVAIQGPAGASLQQTMSAAAQVEGILQKQPEVDRIFDVGGFSFAGAGSNKAIMFIALKPFDERGGSEHSAQSLIARLRGPLMGVPGALVIPFLPPSIQGVGVFGGFQLEIEDRGGGNRPIEELAGATFGVVGAASKDPTISGALATFTVDDPQLRVTIDREQAKALGVSIDAIAEALQINLGASYVNDFDFNDRAYRVYVQADAPYRANPSQIGSLYVRSQMGA